jgi:hypothetical protein
VISSYQITRRLIVKFLAALELVYFDKFAAVERCFRGRQWPLFGNKTEKTAPSASKIDKQITVRGSTIRLKIF